MAGTFANGQCYATQLEAASAYCSQMFWADNSGASYSCHGVEGVSESVGGGIVGTFLIQKVEALGGWSSVPQSRYMYGCEYYGIEYFAPVIGAWFLALVSVLMVRHLYTRVFHREG